MTRRPAEAQEGKTTPAHFLERIFSLPRFAARAGTHRFRELCAPLLAEATGAGLESIKITGSNGKGTVANLVAGILAALGLRTGLYTSPHLRQFGERIRLGSRPANEAELERSWAWLEPRILGQGEKGGESPLAFEAMTALALHVFSEAGVDVVVAEAGIGGRNDAVRALPGRLAVLTSVDLEHTSILGTSLEAIALEKADLAPRDGELLVGEVGPELLATIRRHSAERGVRVVSVEEVARWSTPRPRDHGMVVDLEIAGPSLPRLELAELEIALVGRHQVANAALAVLAAARWLDRCQVLVRRPGALTPQPPLPGAGEGEPERPRMSYETRCQVLVAEGRRLADSGRATETFARAVRTALAETTIPGRFERMAVDPEVWIDIGHTPAAVRALAETVRWRLAGRSVLLVLGVSHDKDAAAIVAGLAPVAERVICTRAHHRGGAVERLVALLEAAGHRPQVVEPLAAALGEALHEARREGMVVLVAGGLFLAIEAAEILAGRDPAALVFY